MDYFTSDTHFNHKNIIKYCSRGAFNNLPEFAGGTERLFNDVEEMNEHLVERWNSTVTDNDRIYHLGDVAFGNKDEAIKICNRLKGHMILVYGNHDLKCKDEYWLRAGFQEVHRLGYGKTLLYENDGWEFQLSHYPYRKDLTEYDDREYLHFHAPEQDSLSSGKVLLHGHVHTQWKTRGNMVNVGVDVWNYRPVSIASIRDLLLR
jgi:calcineurin-like phosphoesterase family protein